NPAVLPNTVCKAAGGQVAIKVGVVGPTSTVTAGHGAGASALIYAYGLAAENQADAMVALAADAMTDTVLKAYQELGALADSEPGTNGANGFALSEGSVALVLERLSKAKARGASIYGEAIGYGITSDASGAGMIDKSGERIEPSLPLPPAHP